MNTIEWARSVKPDLVALQQEKGIPALFAAAQMCHESNTRSGNLSELATEARNFAGLKWSEWERQYGCEPVTYGTWEHLNGQNVNLDAAFCKCPDWATWLKIYAALLTGKYYAGALRYRYDPFLYGYHVWKSGWATDPAYLTGLATWFGILWDDYADTIPMPPGTLAPIKDAGGSLLATGTIIEGRTQAPVRALCESLGYVVQWSDDDGAVTLLHPGAVRK